MNKTFLVTVKCDDVNEARDHHFYDTILSKTIEELIVHSFPENLKVSARRAFVPAEIEDDPAPVVLH